MLIVYKDPWKYMAILESKYMVKPSSIWYTKVYLWADVGKVFYVDGSYDLTMSSYPYVK